jgi:uroporphyrinogen decarboxylase
MNSRELVVKTLNFDNPERIPRHLWFLPWAQVFYPEQLNEIRKKYPADVITAPSFYTRMEKNYIDAYNFDGKCHIPGIYTDEWGCTFENKQVGIIGEVKDPFIKEWDDYKKVKLPVDYLAIDKDAVNEFCRKTDKFVLAGLTGGSMPRPFERMQFLRGTENLYMDLVEQPQEMFDLLKRMHEFNIKMLELWADTEIDAISIMDDWGSQNALLISPNTWRKIFKPLYMDYVKIARHYKKYIFMHLDGYVMEIIPDLIEIGIDAINSQVFCMGPENLKQFRGKISFWGEIDRQWILPYGSPDKVTAAVHAFYENLYQNGGVFAQCEFGAGAKPENVELIFETWNKIHG